MLTYYLRDMFSIMFDKNLNMTISKCFGNVMCLQGEEYSHIGYPCIGICIGLVNFILFLYFFFASGSKCELLPVLPYVYHENLNSAWFDAPERDSNFM